MVAEGDNGRKSKVSSNKVETVSHSGSKESKTNNYSEQKQPKNENNESKANVNSEQKQPKKEHNAGTAGTCIVSFGTHALPLSECSHTSL